MNRLAVIRSAGYKVRYIRECEWKCELREDSQTKAMYNCYVRREIRVFWDTMDPREALIGGRVDCHQLFWKNLKAGILATFPDVIQWLGKHYIKRKDFTSFYIYINKQGTYPAVIMRNRDSLKNPRLRYYGLMHCKILLPGDLYHRVLPQRVKQDGNVIEKSVFTLSCSCAEAANFVINGCEHD